MRIQTVVSESRDTKAAMVDLVDQLAPSQTTPPDFVVAHMSVRHDPEIVQAALSALGVPTVHGGSSCLGVMTQNGFAAADQAGLGLFAVWDAEGDYGSAVRSIGSSARAAASEAIKSALNDAGRPGELPDLVWLTAVPGQEEEVIAGFQDVLGDGIPIVGGSAADNSIAGDWFAFDTGIVETDGIAVSVLFPSRPISTAFQSGYAPTTKRGTVTRAEGRRLFEIDGKPAAAVYADWSGLDISPDENDAAAMILAESTLAPLGRQAGYVADVPFYLLAHPAYANSDGSIDLFANVESGEQVTLMTGAIESLTARAGKVAAMACDRSRLTKDDIAGALVIYCGGCMLAVKDHMHSVVEGIDEALGGAPFLGVFTFGEQGQVIDGQNRHGNLMISCVSFAR